MAQNATVTLPRLRCFTVHMGSKKPRQNLNYKTEQTINRGRNSSISTTVADTDTTTSGTTATVGFGKKKKEPQWQCVQNCGACCKLDKGPDFPSPEEVFDDPYDIQKFKSLIGADGWCIHFDKAARNCTIYADRPYFCRVEPDVFLELYGIEKKKFNREACSCCIDTIKAVYGSQSKELDKFSHAIWNLNAKLSVE